MIKNRRMLLVTLLLLAVALVAYLVLIRDSTKPTKTVNISGIPNCSENIDEAVIRQLDSHMYGFVQLANNFNNVTSRSTYEADVRDGSCKQLKSHTARTSPTDELTVRTSSLIVDIPEAKQSWRITYDWLEDGNGLRTDLGSLRPTCLTSNELKYGDFHCQKVLNVQNYGIAEYDPILKYLPYEGEGFTLNYGTDVKQIIATIIVPEREKDNQVLIENSKAVLPYWFERRALDISKYTIVYKVNVE